MHIYSGGSSQFPDFGLRLENEIRNQFSTKILQGDRSRLEKYQVSVKVQPKKHHVFLGGSVLAELMNDNVEFWTTKKEYDEMGIDYLMAKLNVS